MRKYQITIWFRAPEHNGGNVPDQMERFIFRSKLEALGALNAMLNAENVLRGSFDGEKA